MIITVILSVLFSLLWPLVQLIALLPDVSLTSSVSTSIASASNYLSALNSFIPITTLLSMLGVFVLYETGYFTFKLIYWIIKRIPTQS